jgi:uncharacterized protein
MSDELAELAQQLFDLARSGDTERLAAYLDAGAPVEMRNENGDTLLILAAYHAHPDTVGMLVDRGADVEAQNDRGQRALTCAVFKKDAASAQLLVAAGADPDAGTPSARATADMFGLGEIAALF